MGERDDGIISRGVIVTIVNSHCRQTPMSREGGSFALGSSRYRSGVFNYREFCGLRVLGGAVVVGVVLVVRCPA